VPVREPAKEHRPQRPHEERDGEDGVDEHGGVLGRRVEEAVLKVLGEHGVDVDVVPLDEVAERAAEDVEDGLPRFRWAGAAPPAVRSVRLAAKRDYNVYIPSGGLTLIAVTQKWGVFLQNTEATPCGHLK
jgi:hypothetical protein